MGDARSFGSGLVAVAAIAAIAATTSGCADLTSEGAPVASAEDDFVSKGGVTLTSPVDPDLRISLLMLDGTKERTKNQRFVKALVLRKGRSFGAFCDLSATISVESEKVRVAVVGRVTGAADKEADEDESNGDEEEAIQGCHADWRMDLVQRLVDCSILAQAPA